MDQGSHSSTNLSPKLLGPRCRRALQTTSGPEGHLQTTTMGGDAEHGISMGFVRARLVCKVMLDTFHSAMSSFQIAHRNAASRLYLLSKGMRDSVLWVCRDVRCLSFQVMLRRLLLLLQSVLTCFRGCCKLFRFQDLELQCSFDRPFGRVPRTATTILLCGF